jgi:uncharacterized protein (TIRG00374 family)
LKNTVSKLATVLIPLLIGVAIIYYQFTTLSELELQKIKACFVKANYNYIYLSLVISILGFWFRAYRWKFSLNHLGYQTSLSNNFFTVCVSYLVNLTIPRSGEISRALLLKKYEDVPFDKAFGTIIAERIVDLLLFLLFVIIGFAVQFDTLYQFIIKQNISIETILVYGLLAFAAFITFILIWMRAEWSIILKLKKKLSGLIEGMKSVYQMKDKWWYILYSLSIWTCYLTMFYVTIFALPETASISFEIVIMGFIFGSLAVGFTNGGLGAYPLAIALIFSLYGISNDIGTAFGYLVWTSQTLLTLVLGLLSYLLLPLINKK